MVNKYKNVVYEHDHSRWAWLSIFTFSEMQIFIEAYTNDWQVISFLMQIKELDRKPVIRSLSGRDYR